MLNFGRKDTESQAQRQIENLVFWFGLCRATSWLALLNCKKCLNPVFQGADTFWSIITRGLVVDNLPV